MEVRKVKITDARGLHLREAARIVHLTKRFRSKVYLCHNCKFADSCSILEILALAAAKDAELAVIVDGPDEKDVSREIVQLFSGGAGI